VREYLRTFDWDFLFEVAFELGCQFFYDDEKEDIIEVILKEASNEEINQTIDDLLLSETFRKVV